MIVARARHGCSSRRTISSPRRAVDRQCTRRRSSPRRYSRTVRSWSPTAVTERAALSPVLACSPGTGRYGSAITRGTTRSQSTSANRDVCSTSPNGSVTRIVSGPIGYRPRRSQ